MTDFEDINTRNEELLKLNPELANILGPKPKRSKYKNVRNTDPDGETYDSGVEAEHAWKFALAVRAGEYYLYVHHFRVDLPGGIKMVLDHFLVNKNLQVEIYDSKSSDGKATITHDWRNKQKLFEDTYGIKIRTI